MKNITHYMILSMLLVMFISCNKGFLEGKPDRALLIPHTLDDLQLLLNNEAIMNITPGLHIIASDELVSTDSYLNGTVASERNSYIWAKEIFDGVTPFDWNIPYQQVFYANVVLEGLAGIPITEKNRPDHERLRGSALFYRAFAFYNLSQLFAKPYVSSGANRELGIPIRTVADVNVGSVRATLQETYAQILLDLGEAVKLLPVRAGFKSRPSKASAYGLLARTHLSMGSYVSALENARLCMGISDSLLDYRTLDGNAARPFPVSLPNGNVEVIFHAATYNYSFLISSAQVTVELGLYDSYGADDLRKAMFFNPTTKRFKGSYTGYSTNFTGLAVDEMYLIAAECLAREGEKEEALETLDKLLVKRKAGPYVPLSAVDARAALEMVLLERRKELVTRGLRWTDLRRLNLEPEYETSLQRTSLGRVHVLEPNSPRYVFPIPETEIVASNIIQNDR